MNLNVFRSHDVIDLAHVFVETANSVRETGEPALATSEELTWLRAFNTFFGEMEVELEVSETNGVFAIIE